MNPELDARLTALESKVDETYKMVAQMRRVQRNANLAKIGYWLILIVLAIISLSFIKPYLTQLSSAYGLSEGDTGNSQSYAEQIRQLTE